MPLTELVMEEKQTYFSALQQEAKGYVKDKLLLLKLKAAKELSKAAGMLIVAVLFVFLSFFFFLFLGFALAFTLQKLIDSMVAAWAIVIGFYVLCLVLVILLRKQIQQRAARFAIKKIFPPQ